MCTVDGCDRVMYAKGWCGLHYDRMRRTGSLELRKRPTDCLVCGKPVKSVGLCGYHYGKALRERESYTRTCSVEGCDRTYFSNGFCQSHYGRWRYNGDPGPAYVASATPPGLTVAERWWRMVDTAGPIAKNHPELGVCWLWTGRRARGYGLFSIKRGNGVSAHRFAYELLVGPIPEGLVLDHFACDNRQCCNPAHVRPVTRAENTARGTSGNPGNGRKTHCKRGHPFDERNTYNDPNGTRSCRACRGIRHRERYAVDDSSLRRPA